MVSILLSILYLSYYILTHLSYTSIRKQENKPHNNFVPTTTLLEPNNVIPSWEGGGEEKKEVSVTMKKLR